MYAGGMKVCTIHVCIISAARMLVCGLSLGNLSELANVRVRMALDDVRCFEVIREWYDGLSGLNPSLSENKMLLFDTPWVLQQMGGPDRTATLLELMVENNIVRPSMTDEDLLEAVEAL